MNTKLKCLLLDDELLALQYLKLCCEEITNLEVVKAFIDVTVFLENFPKLEFDFCILDIEMPKMNGLEVAKYLKDKPIIFATAYKEFAFDAFEIEAIDYIQKPINKERLSKAIDKVKLFLNQKQASKFIIFTTNKGKTKIDLEHILYLQTSEIDPRDKIVHLVGNNELIIKNLSFEKMQDLLPKNQFIRINRNELLNLKIIKNISSNEISTNLVDKTNHVIKFYVSVSYRAELILKMKA